MQCDPVFPSFGCVTGMLVVPDTKFKKKKKKKTTVCFKIFNVFRSMCCEVIWNLSFFLSNCTAPIYCNVIKKIIGIVNFCPCLLFSPRISVHHLCDGVTHELHVFDDCFQFISCTSHCLS